MELKPASEFFSVEELDRYVGELENKANSPDISVSAQIAARDHAVSLRLRRNSIEKNIENAIGPEVTIEAVEDQLRKAADYHQDQERVRQNARMLQSDPNGDYDVTPKVARPNFIPDSVKSPVRYREWRNALNQVASGASLVAPIARNLSANLTAEVKAEARQRGLDVPSDVWLYELKHPRDSWPEDIDPNAHDAAVVAGKASPDAVPFWDVATRGELSFVDWLQFVSAHDHLAERVRPRLSSILRAATAEGLVEQRGQRWHTRKLGHVVDIPMALRDEVGAVA